MFRASPTPICVGGPSRRALQFSSPVLVWQAEEAVANLPLRVAVRVHCGHQACAQHDGVRLVIKRH